MNVNNLLLYLLEARLASSRRRLVNSRKSHFDNDREDVLDAIEDELKSRQRQQQQQQQQQSQQHVIDASEDVYDEIQPSPDLGRLRSRLLAAWIEKVTQFIET
jgi:hypothetical protein